MLDSGCGATLINKKFVDTNKTTTERPIKWVTKAGKFSTTRKSKVKFTLPAFHNKKEISWNCYVDEADNSKSNYDMIIGRDMLHELGIDLLFSTAEMTWDNVTIPMHPITKLSENWADQIEEEILYAQDPPTMDAERIQAIVDSKYSQADLKEIAKQCKLLTPNEQQELLNLLTKFKHLFDGQLGSWDTDPIDLELKNPDEKPYHAKPFPVPQSQEKKLREEIERLIKFGVLRKINRSEWAAPMFTIPKPDGTLRSLADFRELNKRIKRKPFPLPKISDMLQKLEGFLYATSLDLNMGYYHILLTPNAARLCTIVLPWGKYEYVRLPMGLCNSPDIFQEKMSELMAGLEFARAYIDDLLVVTQGDFKLHLEHLEKVFTRLGEAGLKINASKSTFCTNELEYLGYLINREGVRLTLKKVEAIKQLAVPRTKKQLRSFIGMVNYYRDVWPKRAHLLAPLSAMTSTKAKWVWTKEHQEAFDNMKLLIAKETLLTYPNFNKTFEIHTDASKVQLGACISQEGKPIAFYSRKLTDAQTRYTTTERELLSIVETLKEFRTILLGQKIVIHTDHQNLTYKQFNSERVMRWRLYIEEYSPDLQYIPGDKNVVADALSRLDKDESPLNDSLEAFYSIMESLTLSAEGPDLSHNPVVYDKIEKAQHQDSQIKQNVKNDTYQLVSFVGGETP